MKRHSTLSRVLFLGLLLALLAYLFHPGADQFQMTFNGVPVADPLVRIGAIPAVLLVMLLTSIFLLSLFFGAGLFLLFIAGIACLFGALFVLPYLWPLLLIVFLVVAIVSTGSRPG